MRLALELLGETAKVTQSRLIQPEGYEVDLYGNAVLENKNGLCAQISFGMDNAYQCQLEVWGSRTTLIAPRVFTAGADVVPKLILKSSNGEDVLELPKDDQFLHSIEAFYQMVRETKQGHLIQQQAEMIEKIRTRGI